MSDHIPFDIQAEILKRLPVKSLIQFSSVSKQWKSFIHNPKFINNYHINHTNPQHHVFLSYELDTGKTYTSITDNNTFPQQKFPLTAQESLSLLKYTFILGSVDGLLCFYCYDEGSKKMVVIWNPTVRKSVAIDIPSHKSGGYTVVGFGVCPDTSVLKLVKITQDRIASMWDVEFFTLSTRVWRSVFTGRPPFKLGYLLSSQVFVNGVIYFHAYDDDFLHHPRLRFNFVISFDLKSEKFGEVCLPERLVHTLGLDVVKVNESLGLLEYYDEGEMSVCGVWSKKDGADKPITKIYTVKVGGKVKVEGMWLYDRVLGFTNNGEVVMDLDTNYKESRIEFYEPLSGHTYGVGINGKRHTFSAMSYIETLLLLDESDSIAH